MIETLTHIQWFVISLAALSIGMSKTGVQGSSESRVELCSDYAESRQSSPLGKMEYIGINAWFFLVVNLLKVPLQAFVWDNITWGLQKKDETLNEALNRLNDIHNKL